MIEEYKLLFNNYIKDTDIICSSILSQLKSKNIYVKVMRKIHVNFTTHIIYYFYDIKNYLIFFIKFIHFLPIDDKIILDVEFTYSSSIFNYWMTMSNEKIGFVLKLNKSKYFAINLEKINIINDFINDKLKQNNYL